MAVNDTKIYDQVKNISIEKNIIDYFRLKNIIN